MSLKIKTIQIFSFCLVFWKLIKIILLLNPQLDAFLIIIQDWTYFTLLLISLVCKPPLSYPRPFLILIIFLFSLLHTLSQSSSISFFVSSRSSRIVPISFFLSPLFSSSLSSSHLFLLLISFFFSSLSSSHLFLSSHLLFTSKISKI